jgi:hypothetical protein
LPLGWDVIAPLRLDVIAPAGRHNHGFITLAHWLAFFGDFLPQVHFGL